MRLSDDQRDRSGAIWNPKLFETKDTSGFEAIIQFDIWGHGQDYYGDGFAFWAVQDSGLSGPGTSLQYFLNAY